jgi:hypothetical protein
VKKVIAGVVTALLIWAIGPVALAQGVKETGAGVKTFVTELKK